MKPPREAAVLAACLQLLRLAGVPAWRANTGCAVMPGGGGGKARFVRFGPPGQSDILGVLPPAGRLLACECKRPGGKLSEAQRLFLDNVTRAGGLALVISDVTQLEAALSAAGIIA